MSGLVHQAESPVLAVEADESVSCSRGFDDDVERFVDGVVTVTLEKDAGASGNGLLEPKSSLTFFDRLLQAAQGPLAYPEAADEIGGGSQEADVPVVPPAAPVVREPDQPDPFVADEDGQIELGVGGRLVPLVGLTLDRGQLRLGREEEGTAGAQGFIGGRHGGPGPVRPVGIEHVVLSPRLGDLVNEASALSEFGIDEVLLHEDVGGVGRLQQNRQGAVDR